MKTQADSHLLKVTNSTGWCQGECYIFLFVSAIYSIPLSYKDLSTGRDFVILFHTIYGCFKPLCALLQINEIQLDFSNAECTKLSRHSDMPIRMWLFQEEEKKKACMIFLCVMR